MKEMSVTEYYDIKNLMRKKSYGKLHVIGYYNDKYTHMTNLLCQSYDTIVCEYDVIENKFKKHWNGYSRTTMRHINYFRNVICEMGSLTKKQWENLKTYEK